MAYICRDCNYKITQKKPTYKCSECGSIYIFPENYKIKFKKKISGITIGDRFLSLLFGAFAGVVTLFVWGILIIFHGGGSTGKGSLVLFYYGFKFSIYFAMVLGLIGFFIGPDRLVKLFGILWGTDKEFIEETESNVLNWISRIPTWFSYLFVGALIIGSYSYLVASF